MSRTFNKEEASKLKQLISESISVNTEIDTLRGGLNDTIAAVAEEMQVKPSIIKKAIKIAQKRDFNKAREELEIIENILQSTDNLQDSQ